MTRARLIGSAVRRVEDPRLVTGAGTYIGDLAPVGMLHAQFVRSPHAHARLGSVDMSAAKAIPGVVAIFTGAEINGEFNPLPGKSGEDGARNPTRTVLADGEVRFVGEAIAVVVAESEEIARDAADAILIDYESLPHVIDLDAAARDDGVDRCSCQSDEGVDEERLHTSSLQMGPWAGVDVTAAGSASSRRRRARPRARSRPST